MKLIAVILSQMLGYLQYPSDTGHGQTQALHSPFWNASKIRLVIERHLRMYRNILCLYNLDFIQGNEKYKVFWTHSDFIHWLSPPSITCQWKRAHIPSVQHLRMLGHYWKYEIYLSPYNLCFIRGDKIYEAVWQHSALLQLQCQCKHANTIHKCLTLWEC